MFVLKRNFSKFRIFLPFRTFTNFLRKNKIIDYIFIFNFVTRYTQNFMRIQKTENELLSLYFYSFFIDYFLELPNMA